MSMAVLGTKTTCLRLVEALGSAADVVVTLDDREDARSRTNDIVSAAEGFGVRALIASDAAAAYLLLREHAPKVVLVAGWYRLIPESLLTQFERGFVGVHYSRLPAYRGSAPVVWQLINGEPEVGFSVFQLTAGMDEGPVALQGSVLVEADDTVATVLDKLDTASLRELALLAPSIADGSAVFSPQADGGESYAGARGPADGWIDWSRPAPELERFVRAQTRPYPGAHSQLDGQLVHVWAAHADRKAQYFGAPGQVVRTIDTRAVVACGDGSGLVLDEIESLGAVKFSLLRSRFGVG